MGKRKTKRKSVQPKDGPDTGTPEFQEKYKGHLVTEAGFMGQGRHKRNMMQVPLDYYHRVTKSISKRQHQAGTRFHQDFARSGLLSKTTPSYEGLSSDSGSNRAFDVSDRQYAIRQKFRQAFASVSGDTGAMLVLNVCCYGFMLRDLALPYYPETKASMGRFKEALDDLADYYGIPIHLD